MRARHISLTGRQFKMAFSPKGPKPNFDRCEADDPRPPALNNLCLTCLALLFVTTYIITTCCWEISKSMDACAFLVDLRMNLD